MGKIWLSPVRFGFGSASIGTEVFILVFKSSKAAKVSDEMKTTRTSVIRVGDRLLMPGDVETLTSLIFYSRFMISFGPRS